MRSGRTKRSTAVFDALAAGNEFVTRVAPWTLANDPARRPDFDRAVGAAVRLLARQAVLLSPVIPGRRTRCGVR